MQNKRQDNKSFGYVLHTRSYSETSLLITIFTKEYGVLNLLAKGAKRQKSKFRGILQPFIPLIFFFTGKPSNLKILSSAEISEWYNNLSGVSLLTGLYINELLIKFLVYTDPYWNLFESYKLIISELYKTSFNSSILRKFELSLLKDMGFELKLDKEALTNKEINPDFLYMVDPMLGVRRILSHSKGLNICKGSTIISLRDGCFSDLLAIRQAKTIMRYVIDFHLGTKKILSRDLGLKILSRY